MTTILHIAKGGFQHLDGQDGNSKLVQNCSCGHRHPMMGDSGKPDTSQGWRDSTKKFEPLAKSGATEEIVFSFGTDRTVLA